MSFSNSDNTTMEYKIAEEFLSGLENSDNYTDTDIDNKIKEFLKEKLIEDGILDSQFIDEFIALLFSFAKELTIEDFKRLKVIKYMAQGLTGYNAQRMVEILFKISNSSDEEISNEDRFFIEEALFNTIGNPDYTDVLDIIRKKTSVKVMNILQA